MGGEHEQQPVAPWVKHGPEPERTYGPETRPICVADQSVTLGFLPDHVDLGTVPVGDERTAEVARPVLLGGEGALITSLSRPIANASRPSAFRDQLGLDPDQVIDDSDARSFALASPAMAPITTFGPSSSPIRIRFKPTRAGLQSTIVTIKVVGADGSMDSRQVRVTGLGKPAPSIVDDVHRPDVAKGMTLKKPDGPLTTLGDAAATARNQASLLAGEQLTGVELAGREVQSYTKAPPPKSEWSWIIDLAVSMGVASIAGVVAKLAAAKLLTTILNRNASSTGAISGESNTGSPGEVNETVKQIVGDGLKDGLKATVKKGLPKPNAPEPKEDGEAQGGQEEPLSSDPLINFFTEHTQAVRKLEPAYVEVVNSLEGLLGAADPANANAALMVVAEAFHAAAPNALLIQARATEFQWVSATAKRGLGSQQRALPDGTKLDATDLDGALDFGERGPYAVPKGTVPEHDGVLDVHVELPVGRTPVETSEFKVRAASITGISSLIAARLRMSDLSAAGIPIRLIVHGHPALITRDEIGNVRVHGYLRTEDGTNWSEAHMHKGAKHLMNRVLAKTLAQWGVASITTDDATTRTRPK